MHGHSAEGPPVDRKISTPFAVLSLSPLLSRTDLQGAPTVLSRQRGGRSRSRTLPQTKRALHVREKIFRSDVRGWCIRHIRRSRQHHLSSVASKTLSCLRAMPVESRHRQSARNIIDNRSEVLIRKPALIFKSFTRSVPTSYSLPTNSPMVAARLSFPLYDFSSPHDRPIRRPTARFLFG
jgi:hypothetical protein